MLKAHRPKCENNDITTNRTSPESHLHWKEHFHRKPSFFRIYADFEADNKIDNSSIGNKTKNIFKENPVLNGYYKESELEDVLQTSYCNSPLGYNNVDWFVDDFMKLVNKLAFYFKNTKKDIIITQEDKEDFKNINICRFCKKTTASDEVRGHCHLTGKSRGPARSKCNNNVTQDKLFHLYFTILVIMVVICFSKSY